MAAHGIWQAADYACGRRLVAMLPEWIPAYEQHERRMPAEAREKLLRASARTLDRLLEPLRVQGARRSLTRPGTLLRQQIPIRGSVWEEGKAGWLEVDTVALCGGSVAGEFVWMLDGVDCATTWVEVRAMWGRGQAGTLAALQDVEASLPFSLLGLDSDNGGEFLNHHVLRWLQQRRRPVFMTRSRPYKKDDNAHVEQKNWTHVRQCFGYERHDNHEVVGLMNELAKGAYGQLRNYFHASLKLERKERNGGRIRRIYGEAQTPLARVLASADVTAQTKQRLRKQKAGLNPFALKQAVARSLKEIDARRLAVSIGKNGATKSAFPGRPVPLRRVRLLRSEPGCAPPAPGKAGNAGGLTVRVSCRSKEQLNKKLSHWVTLLLAQRIPFSGNSYFWRTAICSTEFVTCTGGMATAEISRSHFSQRKTVPSVLPDPIAPRRG